MGGLSFMLLSDFESVNTSLHIVSTYVCSLKSLCFSICDQQTIACTQQRLSAVPVDDNTRVY